MTRKNRPVASGHSPAARGWNPLTSNRKTASWRERTAPRDQRPARPGCNPTARNKHPARCRDHPGRRGLHPGSHRNDPATARDIAAAPGLNAERRRSRAERRGMQERGRKNANDTAKMLNATAEIEFFPGAETGCPAENWKRTAESFSPPPDCSGRGESQVSKSAVSSNAAAIESQLKVNPFYISHMSEAEFCQLVSDATEYLRARIARAREEFGIGGFERYDYDLPTNRFWWSNGGVPQVEARIIIVGSISTTSNTWLWSWANSHFKDVFTPDIERVREYGVQHRIAPLINPQWPADEADGWEMTSISARLLESEAAYRSPSPNGALFLLLNDLKRLTPNERSA